MDHSIILASLSDLTSGNFLIKLLVNAVSLFVAAKFLDGVQLKGFGTAAVVAIVLAVLNVTLGTYLDDLTGFTVGILSFVVDGIVLLVASWLLDGFKIKGLLWAFILAIALALINGLLFRVL